MKTSKKWWKDPIRRLEVGKKISTALKKAPNEDIKICLRIRSLHKYSLWKGRVFYRNNWTCKVCKKYGKYKYNKVKLHVHHIKPFAEILKEFNIDSEQKAILCRKLWAVTNGTVLCKQCHNDTHKKI